MSVLFYRRPDYLDKASNPRNVDECQRYVERAKKSERAIPDGLSFDEVVNNKALPPCSVNDFMDYLVFVEHNAENLQFLLWYRDYERRFYDLPENERALSPDWIQETKELQNLAKDPEKKAMSPKTNTASALKEIGYDSRGATLFTQDRELAAAEDRRSSLFGDIRSISDPTVSTVTSTPTLAEATAQAGLKWQPFTIQPMRDEVNRVMRHYLAFDAPRELNLGHKDRGQCFHAVQHSTHPSALKPAVTIVEAALRAQSHPNFVRWSICNGNKPRIFFVRSLGVSNIAFGFIIAVILTLSNVSRWWRILAAPMFLIGYSSMVASYKGLCVILHHSHTRNLRPWEQDFDSEMGESRRNSFSSTAQRGVQMASRTGDYEDDVNEEEDSSVLRSVSFQTFGPKNSFDNAQWFENYKKRSILSKVFDKHNVWTQDETLRLLQDKIVLGANLWGLILTVISTIVFTALPKGGFY